MGVSPTPHSKRMRGRVACLDGALTSAHDQRQTDRLDPQGDRGLFFRVEKVLEVGQ
jgi:hypothetical protein